MGTDENKNVDMPAAEVEEVRKSASGEGKRTSSKKRLLVFAAVGAALILVAATVAITVAILTASPNIRATAFEGSQTTEAVLESELTQEEKDLYNKAVAREDSDLTGKSVEAIIDGERALQEEEQRQLEELKAQAEAEERELADAVTVSVYKKKVTLKNTSRWRFNDFVELRMLYKNNTDKSIVAFKGKLNIADIFGNSIMNIDWLADNNVIPARGEIKETGFGIELNQFLDEHTKLRDTDFDKLKFTFEIQSVAFGDGSFLGEVID